MQRAPASRAPTRKRCSAVACAAPAIAYRGLPKTHLQLVLTAAAIHLLRIASWLDGVPLAAIRCFHFTALQFKPR